MRRIKEGAGKYFYFFIRFFHQAVKLFRNTRVLICEQMLSAHPPTSLAGKLVRCLLCYLLMKGRTTYTLAQSIPLKMAPGYFFALFSTYFLLK